MIENRKTATKLLLVQWSCFQNVCIKLEGSTLVTGVNGSGKSTILDAMTYALTGNTQFNKAAKDRDRTVRAYVRGDTKSNGSQRYLRSGQVISYIAMEFWSPVEMEHFVAGVCIESADESSGSNSYWFVFRNAEIEDINFTEIRDHKLLVTPKNRLEVKGIGVKSADFMGREKGTEQILRALGLRCEVDKYRLKLLKMMAFNPENNIDQFIQECVLEPGNISSLKELREQREKFDKIKRIYEDMKLGKSQLEKIEAKTQEYEHAKRNLDLRKLMLGYQELKAVEHEKDEIRHRLGVLEQNKKELEEKQEEIEILFENARKRLQAAESNDTFKGMQSSIDVLEEEVRTYGKNIEQGKKDVAKLLELQNLFAKDLSWCFTELTGYDQNNLLFHIGEAGYSADKKREELIRFLNYTENRKDLFSKELVHNEDEQEKQKKELAILNKKVKILEANKMVLPDRVLAAKTKIEEEFSKKGIHTDVRVLAELVSEIRDLSWRKAIETFLGGKRYDIIVDGAYCHAAMKVLQKKKIYGVRVIMTDKLPETEILKGSAAEQLVVPHIYGRKYVNYLLNRIHLCENLEELHEYPKGGLTKDGMLAKSYAVTCMDMRNTEICLGEDAIELQKKEAVEAREAARAMLEESVQEYGRIRQKMNSLKLFDQDINHYRLDAPAELQKNIEKKQRREEELKQMKENPDFVAVLQEQQNAKKEFNEIDKKRTANNSKIAVCKTKYEREKEQEKSISGRIYSQQKLYEKKRLDHLELEQAMLSEYGKLTEKTGKILVITDKTLGIFIGNLNKCIQELEDAQLDYCKSAGIGLQQRGIGYIPFYRNEYRNLANVKIEETHARLDQQAKELESAFMNDFVAEMNETILEAKKEIYSINQELKQIPFGQDTYRFRMDEKPDRQIFFRICKRLEDYMDTPEAYMLSGREDKEMERDIQDFMSMILEEEDESEYTDYRKYFTYDMEISSRHGDEHIIAELSKKQGSASNGEKQTPYFIILAASLLQCYPKKSCCARLAFIDEAFSALSRERIEQMVKYLEENNFQVIYAAPPEKIGSIGQFIHSTVSLVGTGRYTNAVEGLVTFDEIYR